MTSSRSMSHRTQDGAGQVTWQDHKPRLFYVCPRSSDG